MRRQGGARTIHSPPNAAVAIAGGGAAAPAERAPGARGAPSENPTAAPPLPLPEPKTNFLFSFPPRATTDRCSSSSTIGCVSG